MCEYTNKTKEQADERGAVYEIEDYAAREPFASFLPGIAGERGIPLWCFYTNRGQAVSSFGREGKNTPLLEFTPADRAYRETGLNGFRTFVRFADGSFREPFGAESSTERVMSIGKGDLLLREKSEKLETTVRYTTLPGEDFPGLMRQVSFANRGENTLDMEIMDGLPRIVPHGIGDFFLKSMSNTAAAWIETNLSRPEMPEFRVRASIEDSLSVSTVKECNFMLSLLCAGGEERLLAPVVDPIALFGADSSFQNPEVFIREGLDAVLSREAMTFGRYPSAFAGFSVSLEPGESCSLYSLFGYAEKPDMLYLRRKDLMLEERMAAKFRESCALAEELTGPVTMRSGLPRLDAYTQFTGLDNILRGGFPRVWKGDEGANVFHLYNRKHGDMERDYNAFSLPPRPYSSGFGNYRDVNQNRRTDVVLNPDTGDEAVRLFMSLIQSDGYNPLVVHPGKFHLSPDNAKDLAGEFSLPADLLLKDFTPGDLITRGEGRIDEEALANIIGRAEYFPEAEFHEGYWVDHWTYNLDLIEQYLRIFPDREKTFYFGEPRYLWYRERREIRPLEERFLRDGDSVRQKEHLREDEKESGGFLALRSRLVEKLITLAVIKSATLDPGETGLEMEAGRPGWYDALNGLPALFGSSISDGAELLRLLILLKDLAGKYGNEELILFSPLLKLREGLDRMDDLESAHERWLRRWFLRDQYRAAVYRGEPDTETASFASFEGFLERQIGKLSASLKRSAEERDGIMPTYYRYRAEGWKDGKNGHCLPERMIREDVPYFLEGVVKQIRLSDEKNIDGLIQLVRESPLFDKKLKMYRINASLSEMPPTIGRARAFPEGWLENGSIWLHMEYKYLLEILKAERGRAFWDEGRNCLIPFLDPEVYGRSIYENSSFIVSSAYPEKSLHGKGFVSRLSGATAEFLTMWTYFLLGKEPFSVHDGELVFCPKPMLPAEIFTEEGTLEWNLFGSTPVTYLNKKRRDLLEGESPCNIIARIKGEDRSFPSGIKGPDAEMLRRGNVDELIVEF